MNTDYNRYLNFSTDSYSMVQFLVSGIQNLTGLPVLYTRDSPKIVLDAEQTNDMMTNIRTSALLKKLVFN